MKRLNLGIDIGGTKTYMGVVTHEGHVLCEKKIPTMGGEDAKNTVAYVCRAALCFLAENGYQPDDINFIGIGVPGTVDTQTGYVDYCPNLGWTDIPAGKYFMDEMNREAKLIQDSRAAALAEFLFGAGRGHEDIICLTIGTGIGCGIILNKKIFSGAMNTAGELGHMPIYKNGTPCVCGVKGCLEQYASGSAILKRAIERFPEAFAGREPKTETVFNLAYEQEETMRAVIADCVDDLAFGIACAVDLLSPSLVVISGGLCEHESLVIEPLKQKVPQYGYFSWRKKDRLEIVRAQLGSRAPMIGAACLYQCL